MAKWSDKKMADLTRKLADTAIDYKQRCEVLEERWEAACQDAKEAEAYAEELEAKHQEAFQMYVDANEARLDAEAALAKAVEALRFYAWENEMRLPSDGPWGAGSTDFGKVARTTLAELKGQDDE